MTYMKQLKRSTANWNKLEDKRLGLIIVLNEQIENHAKRASMAMFPIATHCQQTGNMM